MVNIQIVKNYVRKGEIKNPGQNDQDLNMFTCEPFAFNLLAFASALS
jgi:hypothetical protein